MYRKYYSYNDMPKPISSNEQKSMTFKTNNKLAHQKQKNESSFLNIENDDLVLIAVLLILFLDDCEDKLLLAAIAFILFFN